MRKNIVFKFIALAGILVFGASCRHMPLYDPTSGVWLSLDIKLRTEGGAEEGQGTKAIPVKYPKNVRVLVYSVETGALVAEDFVAATGGFIDIPVGTYDFVVYGLGTESVRVSGTESATGALASLSAVGADLSMRNNGTEGQEELNLRYPVMYEPDHLFVGKASNMYIPARAGVSETVHIDMELVSMMETWTFVARNVQGAENIRKLTCYITGQIPKRYLWDMRYPSDEACALPLDVSYVPESGTIEGSFNTFGRHAMTSSSVFLNVMIQNDAGSMYQWIFNVTDQFEDPMNKDRVLVVDRPIVIPMGDEGGFRPDVSDWDAEVIWVPL